MDDTPHNNADLTPFSPEPMRKRRFKAVSLRIVLPNLVTLLALCMGLTAIRFAIEGRFETAVLAIIIAAILDGLDGRIARALNGASRFGAELDSLADFIDFGVAPALLLYLWSLHEVKSLGWFAALVFATAAALRLARFNVMIDEPDRPAWHANFFTGMPAPAGACLALLPLYLNLSELHVPGDGKIVGWHIAYMIGIALLMVSRIPHFSGKTIGRIPREMFVFVLFGGAALILLLATYPMEMLVGFCLLYLALIPFAVRSHNRLLAADRAQAQEPALS